MQDNNVFMSEDLKDTVYEDSISNVDLLDPKVYLKIDDSQFNCAFHSFSKVDKKHKNTLSFITTANIFYYLLLEKNIEIVFDLIIKKPLIFNVSKNICKIEKYDDIYLVNIDAGDFNYGTWFF